MQTFLYLATHEYETTSNAFFFNLEEAKTFVINRLKLVNQGINENDPFFCKLDSFRIFKVNIGQCFEGEIDEDGLEKIDFIN